jgi:hypothetical protein
MVRTVSLSIIRSLALYTQQWVYVIQGMLTVSSFHNTVLPIDILHLEMVLAVALVHSEI